MYSVKNHAEFKQICSDTPIKLRRKPEFNKINESVFIDFRILPHIKHIIYNLINKLSSDWSHTIVCGPSNYDYIKKIVSNFKIKIIKMETDITSVNAYNNLLLNTSFWKMFVGEKILIYQEDTYLFHGNITPFMEYDYIGAPWIKDFVPGGYGGNGGLSLRTKTLMITCLENYPPPADPNFTKFDKIAEDVYFCNMIHHFKLGKLAPRKVGVCFSQEQLISFNPMGGHKFWDAHDRYDFIDVPYKIPPPVTSLDKTKIPRNIIQTFRDNHLHVAVFENIKGILKKNKGFSYTLINDSMGIELIKKHFDNTVLNAFNRLKAGAAKGDFIRYIALYIYGGVYLDMDGCITKDLSGYLNNDFVWFYDDCWNMSQWVFMCRSKHPILEKIINTMVKRITESEQNIFLATGPTMVSDVFFSIIKNEDIYDSNKVISNPERKEILTGLKINEIPIFENVIIKKESNDEVLFNFPGYTKDMIYDSNNPRYTPVFNGGKSPDLYLH